MCLLPSFVLQADKNMFIFLAKDAQETDTNLEYDGYDIWLYQVWDEGNTYVCEFKIDFKPK